MEVALWAVGVGMGASSAPSPPPLDEVTLWVVGVDGHAVSTSSAHPRAQGKCEVTVWVIGVGWARPACPPLYLFIFGYGGGLVGRWGRDGCIQCALSPAS